MALGRLKSILGITIAITERRADPRRKVSLKAEAYRVEAYARAAIRNVSRTGLMAESVAGLKTQQTVGFSADGQIYHLAVVRWARGNRFGMELKNASVLLGIEEGKETEVSSDLPPRAKRFDVEMEAHIAILSHPRAVMVRDVSQSGLQIEGKISSVIGQDIFVTLNDAPPILGKVCWSAKGRAGVLAAERMATLRLVYAY